MMTGKRFRMDNVSDIIEFDYNTNEYIQDFMWADGKSWDKICNRLNELYEENEQLKKNCKNYKWYKQYKELLNENEQLKAQLRKGEDVCSICKHRYLTKTNTDKYYIAKCKKEHIECSKGTVNYCEDFEYVKILDLLEKITKGDVND